MVYAAAQLKSQFIKFTVQYERGDITLAVFAARVTELSFDEALDDDLRRTDPELAFIIDVLASDLEIDPSNNADALEQILAYARRSTS